MRAWRMNDIAAAAGLLGRAVVHLPSGGVAQNFAWSTPVHFALRNRGEAAEAAWARARQDARAAGSKRMEARVECERVRCDFSPATLRLILLRPRSPKAYPRFA